MFSKKTVESSSEWCRVFSCIKKIVLCFTPSISPCKVFQIRAKQKLGEKTKLLKSKKEVNIKRGKKTLVKLPWTFRNKLIR